jgi:hypothetical protein
MYGFILEIICQEGNGTGFNNSLYVSEKISLPKLFGSTHAWMHQRENEISFIIIFLNKTVLADNPVFWVGSVVHLGQG